MRIRITLWLPLGVLAGCAAEAPTGPGDAAIARMLWSQLRTAGDWESPDGWDGLQPSPSEAEGAHGAFTRIQLSPSAAGSIGGDILPGGVLVSKDYDTDGQTALQWTAMKKIPDYDSENGDWFWARYTPKGEVRVKGSLQDCSYCHLNGTDGVWSAWLTPDEDTGL